MPLTSTDIFDTLVLSCGCERGLFYKHWVQQGTSNPRSPSLTYIDDHAQYDLTNEDTVEILRRLNEDTLNVYYIDTDAEGGGTLHAVENAPHGFWQFHDRHPFWTDDGWKIANSLTTKGDLVEEADGSRHIEFKGGLVPTRPEAIGAMVDHSLSEWSVFRANENRFGFRLVIPSSLNVQPADLSTYANSAAFISWLESFRTEGPAVPDAFATTNGAFTGRKWRPPFDPDDLSLRRFTLDFASLTMARIPGGQSVIVLTIMLDIDTVDSGYTAAGISTNDFARVVNAASGSIPATGQTVEPPFGASDVTTTARKLSSNDGDLFMAGGLALAQWKDPGSEVQRIMPLTGFGRSIDYNSLATRINGGRWAPRPEERPRVDVIHHDNANQGALWIEPADLFVGYAGTDRLITINNKQGSGMLTVGVEKVFGTPTILLVLQPGEQMTLRVTLELNGDSEYDVVDSPYRYLVRGGSFFNVDEPYYNWTAGSTDFRFRPWFPDANRTLRRDSDEFTFGSGVEHTDGDMLTDGLADSHHVITVQHRGDLIFYQQVEAEVTGSGILKNGHSSVLIRQRGSTVTVLNRFWNPDLSGVGSHRGYTTAYIDECEPGDRYVSGIIYIVSGTTLSFSNYRVNAISQIMRVAPKIIV